MEARVVIVTADEGVAETIRAQATNLGAVVNRAYEPSVAPDKLEWADAVIVDLLLEGSSALVAELAPTRAVLAVASTPEQGLAAAEVGAAVLTEPFSIVQLVEALRTLVAGAPQHAAVVDLRGQPVAPAAAAPAEVADDLPWWATR